MTEDVVRPLGLQNLLTAEQRIIILSVGQEKAPEKNFAWLILSGRFLHITATSSVLSMFPVDGDRALTSSIDAADATGTYDIFGSQTSQKRAGWSPIFISDTGKIKLTGGDASASVIVTALEWSMK